MHETTFALVLLSLFTTTDKAAGIEGDLLEQARRHGPLWFWLQVKWTCLMLFFHTLRKDSGMLLLVSYAIYELMLKLNWWGLIPLRAALRKGLSLEAAQMPSINNVITTLVAFTLGMLVTRLAPRHGAALVTLAAGMWLGRLVILEGSDELPRFLIAALVPVLCGTLLMKWLEVRRTLAQDGARRLS